jgi:Ser/Thr protein kinase RdoA (MazF antagonist)
MQMDHVSLDIARLLGSLRFTRDKQIDLSGRPSDDLSYWQAAITAYSQIRRLNEAEIALIPLLDASGILLGSMSWLNWILIENRSFENLEWVQARIEFLVRRLQQLIAAYQ